MTQLNGRALLIGSALDGLTGVKNDLDAMEEALTKRFLSVDRCEGGDATRAGILAACERLVADTRPGEAVAFYYSGHGGRVAPPAADIRGPDLMDMQFIVPVDFHDNKDDGFRGITSVELSVLLTRLTRITRNVTAVFDCCHSARMSREKGLRAKGLAEESPYEWVRDHIERMRASGGLQIDRMRSTGDPDLVRIAACAPDQSAFEYDGRGGRRIGMLTESLTMALAEAGVEPVTWAAIMDRVSRRVLMLEPGQRPEVAGPSRRLLFHTAEADVLGTLPVVGLSGDRAMLQCAPLLGVQKGDRFLVMPPNIEIADESRSVGELTVQSTGPLAAEGLIEFRGEEKEVPIGARAFQLSAKAASLPVLVPADDPRAEVIAAKVDEQPLLRRCEPDERWLAAVRIAQDGRLRVEDRAGELYPARDADDVGLERVMRDLATVARAAAVRAMTGDPRWALNAPVDFTWGRVGPDGERYQLAISDVTVHVGEPIYLSIRNNGDTTVYVSLIDVGVAGKVSMLNDFAPLGITLRPGSEYVFGFDDYAGVLTGSALLWPEHVDPTHARPEAVRAIVMSEPQNIGALAQQGVGRPAGRLRPPSALEAMTDQMAFGVEREFSQSRGPAARYDVLAIDFELSPVPDEGGFLIDERPKLAELHRAARARPRAGTAPGSESAPVTVALRIEELVVHRNRALMSASNIRVDAIVLTAPYNADLPSYRASTARFAHIRRGEPLPLDRMLVYHGPALEYLDVALWVSRDAPDVGGLSELLAEEISGFEMQEALAKLTESAATIPYVGAAATALSLSAVVVNVAYKLLRGSVSETIGLYRGSMLAHEGFRVGRHPADGVRRVQDFSLAYSIERIPGPSVVV